MGPKGNLIMGVLVVAIAGIILALCSSTAFQDYLIEVVKGN